MDVAVVAGDFTGYASPMKLLEYMSMERAVIAPRQRNIQDIVEDGVDDGNRAAPATLRW